MVEKKADSDDMLANHNRRKFLTGTVAGMLTMPLAGNRALADNRVLAESSSNESLDTINLAPSIPFYGTGGQAGVTTLPQRHIVLMIFKLTCRDKTGLQILLARWSAAIAQLMAGEAVGEIEPASPNAIGSDTGEALELAAASLTVTLGLGPAVFSEQFGTHKRCPAKLRPLIALPSDNLEPGLRGGDLSIQACADDPQVAWHAVRTLARIAKNLAAAETYWTVMGFGRASAGKGQTTPRNLFGFKDGTRNLSEPKDFAQHVWINSGPKSQQNGTYQVVRKIRMHIENWDTDRVADQNAVFGRHKISGAPLSGENEFDTPCFDKTDQHGEPKIPLNSHIHLAAHENNQGVRILRRSYNYTDGLNALGLLDAGLLFISYQNDPAHFEKIQQKLGASDALNEYISHIGSGIFFIPPAAKQGEYLGAFLFEGE